MNACSPPELVICIDGLVQLTFLFQSQVLDARDPMGTRSQHIEKYMKTEKTHKHLILVLNKVDLVPTWVTQKWVALLSAEYPTGIITKSAFSSEQK